MFEQRYVYHVSHGALHLHQVMSYHSVAAVFKLAG